MSFNPLNYVLCFEKPRRLTDITSWHEHIPFAFTIVQMLKPKIFVELGTHKGDSYCAFCQAVNILGLDTACYAIDTWEGDKHAGFYGSEILEELRAYHDSLYKGFSQLIQSRFEDALDYFSDGSIDLIHIDGCHTYDAIKHDFEAWLPKMSQHGVVLLHDTNVHENDFGAWKFWGEIKEQYPCFEFKHGHGLGVISVGSEVSEELLAFLNMGQWEAITTTKFYSYLGDKITLGHQLQRKSVQFTERTNKLQARDGEITELNSTLQVRDTEITELKSTLQVRDTEITELNSTLQVRDTEITELNSTLQVRDAEIIELNSALQSMQQSVVWRLLMKYQRLIDTLLPHTTKGRHVHDLGIISIRIIVNDGLGAFLYRLKERVHESALNASKIALIQTNPNHPYVPLSLAKNLCGKFTFPTNNLNEVRILTATYQRQNSVLELHVTNTDGQIIRKSSVKGYKIQNNEYTSFKFKPINDSKEQTFIFKLISKGEPSAAVWHNESVTFSELSLIYNDAPLNGCLGFQAFADIGRKSRYDIWILKNEPTTVKLEQYKKEIQDFEYKPKISILTPVYNPDVSWIEAAIESVRSQVYENWELCLADASTKKDVRKSLEAYAKKDTRIKVKFLSENGGISRNSNKAMDLATGEYIGLLDHDDELSPDSLYEVVKYLQNNRNVDMIYSDEDKIDLKGNRSEPFFKPDWSPDMFLSCMYTCHFGVYSKKIVVEIGGFREDYDGSQDYDLVLRIIEKTNSIHHIPKILYHWRTVHSSVSSAAGAKNYAYVAGKNAINDYMKRNNIEAEVSDGFWTGSYYTKRKLFKTPLLSVIIPTKDHVDVLKRCIDSIFQKTSYSNFEIIIVDNNSTNKKTFDYFEKLEVVNNIKILKYNEAFNFSEINNFAVQHAEGEVILFLNNDTEIITNGWITAMLEHAQRSEVGAVGCKLLYPNKTIQHAGVILGITSTPSEKGVAGHSHKHFPTNSNGYIGRINMIHNVSAVTAACMMLRKDVFEEVGGFDEKLAIAFNDIDLCLKIRQKMYLIVYTPYAELYHHESLSRGYEDTPDKQERFSKEVKYMRDKWGDIIDKGDPYYNPNLTLEREDFSIWI